MFVLLLIGTVLVLWVWSRKNRNRDEPPVGAGSKILIGHALRYTGNSVQLWKTIKAVNKESFESGGVLKSTIGPKVIYVVTDPEDVTTVANTCLQKHAMYNFGRHWLGDGLVTSSASEWQHQRKLLNPAFSQSVLDSFIDIFNKQSRYFIENLKVEVDKGPFDILPYTQSCALQTVCSTTLGVDFREKTAANIEFVKAVSEICKIIIIRIQSIVFHSNILFNLSSLKRKQDKCIKILHNMSNTILRQKKESLEGKKGKDQKIKPFMDLLLQLSHDTNIFTDQEIREHVDTIIAAGHDTTATVLFYSILLVGSYPQVQEKIHEELKIVFDGEDRDITKKDLSQLTYLEAVIKESMRIYPAVPVIARELEEDVKLRNCTLLKGNSVVLFIYGVNQHPMWGPDFEEFKPERWLDPSTLPDHAYTSASFSIGRRNCLGKIFAMMSMKVILAHFFRSYMVKGDHSKLTLQLNVMLKPVSGHHITIEKRI